MLKGEKSKPGFGEIGWRLEVGNKISIPNVQVAWKISYEL
jgi:hypothetical protein